MSDNLSLWNAVEKTPVEHTKAITGKPYSGTSPKPHYLIHRATETFGPCGIGWGFTVDERVEDGAMIEPGHFEKMHVAKVTVWYEWGGKRGEVSHVGGTPFSGKRSNGKPYTDEDAPKKSVTDALVKALSMIGFAGDIFMGRYDDSKYVNELRDEAREAARPKPDPAADDLAASMLDFIETIQTTDRATQWWNDQSRKGDDGRNAFDALTDDGWAKVERAFKAKRYSLTKEAA